MTRIGRTVTRETFSAVRDSGKVRPVVVIIEPPNLIGFRLKGTRRTYYLTAEACYMRAVQAHLAAEKAEKAKARKAARRERRG